MRTPAAWSLGTLIGLPVTILLIVGFVALALYLLLGDWRNRDDFSNDDGFVFGWISAVCAAIVAVTFVFCWWPFDNTFHRYYKVDGEVEAIASRQISDGKAMSTRYVVRLGGEDYGVDDTRASLLKVGDEVHLMCKKEWVYNSESGWACNWSK